MPLPLPTDELPEKLRRFAATDAPVAAKTMAARGLVPLGGDDLVILLVQLSADSDEGVAAAAVATLTQAPEEVLLKSCSNPLPPAILEGLAEHFRDRPSLLAEVAANPSTPTEAVVSIARFADERTCERIATNQERLLASPEIIEALYKNRNAWMSTIDRLVEMAARHDIELSGIATFAQHVEAIQDQLIPDEILEEPLPSDQVFAEALEEDEDEEAIERDKADGTEEVKQKLIPLQQKILQMSLAEKVRMTLIGNAAARSILVRDPNKMVAMAAVGSPSMTDAEAARIALSKQVGEDVLRYIANRRDWLSNYELKRNLLFNSKTPPGISMKFLSHLRANDLRSLGRSKNVPASLRNAARQRLAKKGNG